MRKPIRYRFRRGEALPNNTVYVGRPSKWGNPYKIEHDGSWWVMLNKEEGMPFFSQEGAHRQAVQLYREHLQRAAVLMRHIGELRDKNLACWCAPELPCHADVLLEIANA